MLRTITKDKDEFKQQCFDIAIGILISSIVFAFALIWMVFK